MHGVPGRSRVITIGLAMGAVLLAILTTLVVLDMTLAAGRQSPIAGDPPQYDVISVAILDGAIPYLDIPVEHLPGTLIPMVAVGFVSRAMGSSFETLWPFAMGIAFVAAVATADSFPTQSNGGRRFLLLSLPLLPLVLFRVEPWLMVWVVASLSFAFSSSWGRSSISAAIAAVTKGWPLILFAIPFRLGRRRLAATAAILTLLTFVLVAVMPGFREGRAFEGIHTETIIGNLVLVYRGAIGSDLQLVGAAGATYVSVGQWAVALNVLVAIPILAIAIRGVLRHDTVVELVPSIGLGVLGIILASPLFSSQFLFWLVPFVLFLIVGRQWMFSVIASMTFLTVVLWIPSTTGWNLLVLARNILLLTLAFMWALDAASQPPDSTGDPILENVS